MKNDIYQYLNARIYLALFVMVSALFGLYWFATHSYLTIKVTPPDAMVTINNAPVSLSAAGKIKRALAPGAYSLRIEADGYVGYIEEVALKRTQRKTVSASLTEAPKVQTLAESAKFLSAGPDFNTIHYLGDDGRTLYRAKTTLENGEVKLKEHLPITEPRFSGLEEIVWSPGKELALLRKSEGIYLFDFKKYDFINQTETLWAKSAGSLAWSPDNSKIAYYYADDKEKSLIFTNIANTEPVRVANLAEMNIVNPILRWSPDSEWLLVIPRNTFSYDLSKVYAFNAYSRSFIELTETGSQLDASFSPDGNRIIYGTYSELSSNPVTSLISIMDKDGANKRSLNLRADISRMAWKKDSKTLVAATYNPSSHKESLFGFDTEKKQKIDFSVNALDSGYIRTLAISDDEKIIIFESGNGIYGIAIE
ncbi:MAG: PEGA domain-containing protein [Patescibacteria group bacterium]